MDFPEDLGQRIVEATRLAVMLHIQQSLDLKFIPGGTGRNIGGVVFFGGAATDGGHITPLSAQSFGADALAAGGASAAAGGTSAAAGGASAAARGASAAAGGASAAESEAP